MGIDGLILVSKNVILYLISTLEFTLGFHLLCLIRPHKDLE